MLANSMIECKMVEMFQRRRSLVHWGKHEECIMVRAISEDFAEGNLELNANENSRPAENERKECFIVKSCWRKIL